MALSVRLDVKMERLVKSLAKREGQTQSEVIRKAIKLLAGQKECRNGDKRPYELIADLIGCVRGGPPDLSIRTGEKFRRLLIEKGKGRK